MSDTATSPDPGDPAPKNLTLGVINPYALVESILDKKIDWTSPDSAKILSDTLQTDYNELFDMKYGSPLYAGLKLNTRTNTAEQLTAKDIHILTEADLETPNLSKVKKLADLQTIGIKEVDSTEIKHAWFQNGKLNLVLNVPGLVKKLSNTALTKRIFDLVLPFRETLDLGWTPPNTSWQDVGDFFKDVTEYNDPVQQSVANCYLIAAMAAVAWANPYTIVHRNRATGPGETTRTNAIQFFSKGGGKDAPTAMVEVTDKIIVRNSNNSIIYCRSNDTGELWPSLYEKAFAKWITKDPSDFPDITKTAYGNCVKATAQINNKTPFYYYTDTREPHDLWQLVRANSLSYKTFNPMTAWTYGSGDFYTGSNIVANHCYTILGWAYQYGHEYIVLRNPWGNTEPAGLGTYQGLLSFFDKSFWRGIEMVGNDGVFALESWAFKIYFAGLGVAK